MLKAVMVFMFAMSAASALAEDWHEVMREDSREFRRRNEREREQIYSDLRADSEMEQRERLDGQRNDALRGIETELMIMNSPPYRR